MSEDSLPGGIADPALELRERRRRNLEKARAARKARAEATVAAPMVGSPEFAEAVQAAAAEAAQRIVAELLAKQASADHSPSGDLAWARGLANAMAEIADQGAGRAQQRVPAEEMARRTAARERMTQLLIDVRARGMRPVYQLRDKVELDVYDNGRYVGRAIVEPIWIGTDRLHYPTEIEYDQVPNEEMVPLDDEAKAIYAAFMESIGNPPYDPKPLGVTHGGAVIRGGAAAALFQSTGGRLGIAPGDAGHDRPAGGATIRRHQPALTKTTHILGTLHPPARENA